MINRFLSLERNFQSVKESLREESLPIQIGWNLSVKKIDTFFERHDTRGYKFDIDLRGNVFIVEMEKAEHFAVVKRLDKYFEVPNGGVADDPPIEVYGNSAHYRPRGRGKPSAPDIAIYPGLTIIPKPRIPAPPPQRRLRFRRRTAPRPSRHLEIPPVDKSGRPHARIMCEIAVSQSYGGQNGWNAKCSRWMRQQYVRCVFGVKIYKPKATRNANGQLDRCMIARLWTRQAAPTAGHTAVPGQTGVYYEEWNFGTLDYNTGAPTACIGPGLVQVNIPTQDVFWNPPIVSGALSTVGYVITVPGGVTAPNFVIDLFQIQQVVLANQDN